MIEDKTVENSNVDGAQAQPKQSDPQSPQMQTTEPAMPKWPVAAGRKPLFRG